MNLYEWEGKEFFQKFGITIPRGVMVRRGEDVGAAYAGLGVREVVVKAQILVGKRKELGGIIFCFNAAEVESACADLFSKNIGEFFVGSVLIEERVKIVETYYLSISYDTALKRPVLIYCKNVGDIENAPADQMQKIPLDLGSEHLNEGRDIRFAKELWKMFQVKDLLTAEINPCVINDSGYYYALDAKVSVDDDAFFRHGEYRFEPRSALGRLPTPLEQEAMKIDAGENYYRGTAGKYLEMDGDVGVLFSGGGASISGMDALIETGLQPANYCEYSGNPPREKVYQLTKIVLSKPGLRGLWIAGAVANFTNIAETFSGVADALDEFKPKYPIVVRRAGPSGDEGVKIIKECAERNGLNLKFFGKETSMGETARVLAEMIQAAL